MASNVPPICSRLPPHVADALDADCAQTGLSRTEILNNIVEAYYFGGGTLLGPDAGYLQGRSLATQLARVLILQGLERLPDTHEDAVRLIREYATQHVKRAWAPPTVPK